jgi:hypothetical protein
MSLPRFQQRDHIYVVGPPLLPPTAPVPQLPNEFPVLSSVAPGQNIAGLEVTLDKDAPFVMRRRALRVRYDTAQTAGFHLQNIPNLMVRFSGQDKHYLQQSHVPQSLDGSFFGQLGSWKPVYPGVAFPAGGSFVIDVINNSAITLTNLTFYFRGVKLFPWGVRPDYRYPSVMSSLPYYYTIAPFTNSNPFGVIQSLGVTDIRLSQVFTIQDDADYVIRAMASGPVPVNQITPFEVFFQLRDFDQKPYSTGWVHLDVYGGVTQNNIAFDDGGGSIQAIGTGPSIPNVFFPEIYVPRNQSLFYDIMRLDAAFSPTQTPTTIDYPITFIGAKAFDRTA